MFVSFNVRVKQLKMTKLRTQRTHPNTITYCVSHEAANEMENVKMKRKQLQRLTTKNDAVHLHLIAQVQVQL